MISSSGELRPSIAISLVPVAQLLTQKLPFSQKLQLVHGRARTKTHGESSPLLDQSSRFREPAPFLFRDFHLSADTSISHQLQIAASFPCIVPAGLIDETEETVPTAESSGSGSATLSDPAHLVSETGNVRIEPPRADRMNCGGRI